MAKKYPELSGIAIECLNLTSLHDYAQGVIVAVDRFFGPLAPDGSKRLVDLI
jgi:hypothetical protein